MPVVRCAFCKKYIDREKARRYGLSSYCDLHCMSDHMWAQRSSKNAFKVSTGKQSKKPKTDVPKATRDAVLLVDKVCRSCFTTKNLHLHHVVYRGQKLRLMEGDHQRHNLITLCRDCHEKVHSDKKRYQPLLLALIWMRDVMGSNYYTLETIESLVEERGML